jgi:hypothetical protein
MWESKKEAYRVRLFFCALYSPVHGLIFRFVFLVKIVVFLVSTSPWTGEYEQHEYFHRKHNYFHEQHNYLNK